MISQHHFSNVFRVQDLNNIQSWANVNLIASETNPYLEEVDIPPYDASDDTHVLIPDEATLSSNTFNGVTNPLWQHFYIRPNDYTSQSWIEITANGTDADRKTISPYTPNDDRHPAQMLESEAAQVMFLLRGDYWIFDRMAIYGEHDYSYKIYGGQHVIINRMYSQDNGYPCMIDNGSHYFTLQNSRFVDQTSGDGVGANIVGWEVDITEPDGTTHFTVLHTKIIRNEFRNQNDAFQASVHPPLYGPIGTGIYQYANVGGLIINDNDMWITYIADRENGTDTKCGSPNPKLPVDPVTNPDLDCIISGNRLWGYNDPVWHLSGGANDAILASMHSNGYKIYDNVIFDSIVGMAGGSNSSNSGIYYSYVDSEIYNNIIIGAGDPDNNYNNLTGSIRYHSLRGTNVHDNYFIAPLSDKIGVFGDNRNGSYFTDNKVVAPYLGLPFYCDHSDGSSDAAFIASCDTTYEVSRNGFTDYVFTMDKFTNNPTEVRLSEVLDPAGSITSPNDNPLVDFEADKIQISSDNPWFWQYKQEPVMLVGGSSADGLFRVGGTAMTDELDLLQSVGGNYIRNVMGQDSQAGQAFVDVGGGIYDLDQPDPTYWGKLTTFLDECLARDIIVQIEVWDRFDFKDSLVDSQWVAGQWSWSAWHPSNNINYTFGQSGFDDKYDGHNQNPYFYTPPPLNGTGGTDTITPTQAALILGYQQQFVDQLLSISLDYPNVLYTIENETGGAKEFGEYWAGYMQVKATEAFKTIYITDMRGDWNFLAGTNHEYIWDKIPDTYDFTDISQGTHDYFIESISPTIATDTPYFNRIATTRAYLASKPCPINMVKIYGNYNNSWVYRTFGWTEEAIARFWAGVIGGVASARFHRDEDVGYGIALNSVAQAQLKGFRLVEALTPWQDRLADSTHSKISNRSDSEAFLSYKAGSAYVVYFYREKDVAITRSINLNMSGESGTWDKQWIDLDTGTAASLSQITPTSSVTLTTPSVNNYGYVCVLKRTVEQVNLVDNPDFTLNIEGVTTDNGATISWETGGYWRTTNTDGNRYAVYTITGLTIGAYYTANAVHHADSGWSEIQARGANGSASTEYGIIVTDGVHQGAVTFQALEDSATIMALAGPTLTNWIEIDSISLVAV